MLGWSIAPMPLNGDLLVQFFLEVRMHSLGCPLFCSETCTRICHPSNQAVSSLMPRSSLLWAPKKYAIFCGFPTSSHPNCRRYIFILCCCCLSGLCTFHARVCEGVLSAGIWRPDGGHQALVHHFTDRAAYYPLSSAAHSVVQVSI